MAQILLVDDEKVARALYGDFLTGAGHDVTAVGSVEEAQKALTDTEFDLLVTDLILPQGDGLELLQFAKTTWPSIEVVLITALDKVEPAVRAIKGGASDYLVKPVTPEVLAHSVRRALAHTTLLKENEALHRHVAILEAGQRLATTLDRDKLLEAAGSTFSSICQAPGVALFTRVDDTVEPVLLHGVAQALRDEVLAAIGPAVARAAATADRQGSDLTIDELPEYFETAFLLPAWDGDTLLGAVLLMFEGDVPEVGVSGAPVLVHHLVLALKNVGQFKAVEELAYLDDLTHLFNARYLDLVLGKEFKATGDKPFSLLFLDLDYFKSVNDAHGHVVGSKLLVEVSRVLKGCVRDNDVLTRWGGDEYVVMLRGTDSGGAVKVGERIRREVESHRFLAREGYGLTITTCIGVASFPEHAKDKAELLDLADRAMYRGKKSSRNIIYLASKGLEATPASRHQSGPLPQAEKPADPSTTQTD